MSEIEISFRPMKIVDLPEVIGLENEVYPFPWSEQIFSDCIRVGYDCWLAHGTATFDQCRGQANQGNPPAAGVGYTGKSHLSPRLPAAQSFG